MSTKVFIISDSVGETANSVAKAASAQFPNEKFEFDRYPFTQTTSLLDGILKRAQRQKAVVFSTFVNPELNKFAKEQCEQAKILYYDVLTLAISLFKQQTGQEAANKPGTVHNLDEGYFDKIAAMEFAVTYDDGKDPTGFLKADIVLLGVSRTSKTPLSLYLANKGFKVANLPLVPQASIPEEIWKVDPKKIFGLTTTPEVLNDIRRQRMIAYGLNPDSSYSNTEGIKLELDYADKIFKRLGCLVIKTSNKSIEETATLIMESLDVDVSKE